jgi:hypothetical protein
MLAKGQYSVWFKTKQGDGVGVILLADGRIVGNDTMVSYEGSYTENGDNFEAFIKTKRHSPGTLPLFQIDELDIELRGTSSGPVVSATGRVKQVPETSFDVLLIRIAHRS